MIVEATDLPVSADLEKCSAWHWHGLRRLGAHPGKLLRHRRPRTRHSTSGQSATSPRGRRTSGDVGSVGWSRDGLPIGLQIVGPWHAEDRVISAAALLEKIRPWGPPDSAHTHRATVVILRLAARNLAIL